MGITGLLPFLEKATRPCNISEFRGGTVAVDTYCWLHKGATACAEQLARGEDTQVYVSYCMRYVKMLLSYDIHPIMVFDGRNLPAKADTEKKRRDSRKKAKQRAAELLRLGKTDEARNYFRQCVDITPAMAHNLIKECRKLNVDCIVAPYEADAQLAFFSLKKYAELIITEDSDLVLFGCKKVCYKLDLNGNGQVIETEKIYLSMKMRPDQYTFDKFRFMCILSGCDYVNSLSGIGLKNAQKFMGLTAETDPEKFLDKIPRYLNKYHLTITDEYKKSVMIANATFLHQTVFDPFKKKLVPLIDMEKTGTNPDHCVNCGDIFDHEIAYGVAAGNLNPYSFEKVDNWEPPPNIPSHSIWSGYYKKRISRTLEKQKAREHFQNFLTKPTSASKSDSSISILSLKQKESTVIFEEIEDEETINKEIQQEREELFRNLDYYKNITIAKEVEPTPLDKLKEEKTSPIINKNPFLVKKKLSKFPKTETDSKVVVKSRFFSPTTADESVTKESNQEEEIEDEETLNNMSLSLSQSSNAENIDNSNTPDNPNKLGNSQGNSNMCDQEEDITQMSKKRCIENMEIVEIDDESNDSSVNNSQMSVQETETKIENEKRSAVVLSQKFSYQSSFKKKFIGPCRRVGLSKKSIRGQSTLHNFFGGPKKD